MISGGALAIGALLPLAGRVTDWVGPRIALIAGSIGFLLPLLLLVAGDSAWQVITARTMQGAAAALLLPATYSMTIATFPGRRGRSLAIGMLAIAGSMAAAAGALLAGLLVDLASWRFVFVIVLVTMLGVLFGSIFLLGRSTGGYPVAIDIVGTGTVTLGLLGIVWGFSQAGQASWGDPRALSSLSVGLTLCIGFLIVQHHSRNPFLPLVIFRDRDRAGGMVAMFAAGFGSIGTSFFLTLHMTVTLGLASTIVGVTFVAQTVTQSIVTALVLARGGHLLGPRTLVPLGLLAWSIGAAWIATGESSPESWATVVVPAVVTIGIGSGLLYAAVANVAILHLDHSLVGVASAVASALPQIGGALGAAMLGALSLRHGETSDFVAPIWASAGAFLIGAAIALILLRPGTLHDQPRMRSGRIRGRTVLRRPRPDQRRERMQHPLD